MIRSLYARLTFAFVCVLVLALVSFVCTLGFIVKQPGGPEKFVKHSFDLNVATAQAALAEGGKPALAEQLQRMDAAYNAVFYLLDTAGIDLLDGTDRSELLLRSWKVPTGFPPMPPPFLGNKDKALVHSSTDGQVLLVMTSHPMPGLNHLVWNFVWIPIAVVIVCLLLAYRLVRPLVKLRTAVERFGGGDMTARAQITRTDEIGDLARSFDQTAERVERLVTAERRLLQDVSHELRSPLARVSFAVELAESGPDRAAALDRVRREVRKMADLIGELIDLTQAEGEPGAVRLQEIDLAELVQAVVTDAQVEAEARGMRVETTTQPCRWTGNGGLLHRAVENVVRNAVRYSPSGTVVEVTMSVSRESIRLTVRDHGPGVPDPMLEAIFSPFVRVEEDRGRDTGGGGVGLGLSIARRAVSVHGGTINARNAQPGLEVTISLPVGFYKA
jgi:signal transduction histidine kinase